MVALIYHTLISFSSAKLTMINSIIAQTITSLLIISLNKLIIHSIIKNDMVFIYYFNDSMFNLELYFFSILFTHYNTLNKHCIE